LEALASPGISMSVPMSVSMLHFSLHRLLLYFHWLVLAVSFPHRFLFFLHRQLLAVLSVLHLHHFFFLHHISVQALAKAVETFFEARGVLLGNALGLSWDQALS